MTLKLTVIGNVTKDAVLRRTQNGDAVLGFSVARTDRRTDKTTYVDCSLWGKRADALSPYVTKGTKVYVEGELGTREYEGRTYITCNVSEIELVGGKRNASDDEQRTTPPSNSRHELDDEIPF
jgi:single-strand DNA-binding protein